ncbi:MAG: restriction endonuclease, partial [Halanaerobium sp.]
VLFIVLISYFLLDRPESSKNRNSNEEKEFNSQDMAKIKVVLRKYIDKKSTFRDFEFSPLDNTYELDLNAEFRFEGLERAQNYLEKELDITGGLSLDMISELIYSEQKTKNIIDRKSNNFIEIMEHEVRKLLNKSINSALDIPKTNFSDDFITTFKEYLLEKKDIQISNNVLSLIIEKEKLNMYSKELEKAIDSNRISDITHFSKKYLDIYGYSIDEDYIVWMINVFDLNLMVDDVIKKINNIKNSRRKKKNIEEMDKFLNSNADYKKSADINDIDMMTGEEFEYFLKDLFIRLGYDAEVTQLSGDQGADLIVEKDNRIVIQAKRYSNKVSNSAIQEVIGAKKYYNAKKAMVITNYYFTKSAKELAEINDVILWNRDMLKEKVSLA